MRLLLAGGGTAGHTSPLLAVAEAVGLRTECEFIFVGGRRGIENRVIPQTVMDYRPTLMPSLRDPDSRLSLLLAALVLPIAVLQAAWTIVLRRPRAILTAGGLVSLPVALAGWLLRVPVLLWDGDAVPGRVDRLLARFAHRVAATFPDSASYFPRHKVIVTGNPIRRALLGREAAAARAALGLLEEIPVVMASGGSQGSATLNATVRGALPRLLERTYVLHLCGTAHLEEHQRAAAQLVEPLRERYRPYAFLGEEMGDALAAADVILGRAGSSTIYESLAVGRPLILVPFEASASAHQLANARAMAMAGAAVVVRESELDPDRLAALLLGLLTDPTRLGRMRQAAARAGRPDAAAAIAGELLALAG